MMTKRNSENSSIEANSNISNKRSRKETDSYTYNCPFSMTKMDNFGSCNSTNQNSRNHSEAVVSEQNLGSENMVQMEDDGGTGHWPGKIPKVKSPNQFCKFDSICDRDRRRHMYF